MIVACCSQAMQYSNVVINMIGKDTETSVFSFKDVHVDGARMIARLARESGVEKLIHFSALNAVENPKRKTVRTYRSIASNSANISYSSLIMSAS